MHIAASADLRQACGIRAFEQLFAVFGGLDAQTDSELHVRAHLIRHHARWPLGGQNERYAKRATESRDALKFSFVVRVVRDHLGELVDDDKQMREGFGEGRAGFESGDDLLTILDQIRHPSLGQNIRAPVHLSINRDEDALDLVAFEIRGDVDTVRQFSERLDGRAALVID